MTKTTLALVLLICLAVPAFAQTNNELGISFGGVTRRPLGNDKNDKPPVTSGWDFGSAVKEVYYSVALDPNTRFKIRAGDMDSSLTFITTTPATPASGGNPAVPATSTPHNTRGSVEHIDALVDYRFAEPFGSTGLFAGAGIYRQKGGGFEETNYGFSAGVNADFPFNKRTGLIIEGTYHWTNFDASSRYITATAGLRYKF